MIPLLPWQSPKLVPDQGAEAPAAAMSRKSILVKPVTAAAVIVLCERKFSEYINLLDVMVALPLNANVPVTDKLASRKNITCLPITFCAAKVKLLNVLFPKKVIDVYAVFEKITLFQTSVWLEIPTPVLVAVKVTVDVPAFKVVITPWAADAKVVTVTWLEPRVSSKGKAAEPVETALAVKL